MAIPATASRPVSLWIAVLGAAVAGVVFVGFGIASLASNHQLFSAGIGAMLIGYGLLVSLGAYLGWRRNPLARGLIVAPALLHVAIAFNLLQGGDVPQRVGAGIALAVSAATVVAAVLPSTRAALDGGAGTPRA